MLKYVNRQGQRNCQSLLPNILLLSGQHTKMNWHSHTDTPPVYTWQTQPALKLARLVIIRLNHCPSDLNQVIVITIQLISSSPKWQIASQDPHIIHPLWLHNKLGCTTACTTGEAHVNQ